MAEITPFQHTLIEAIAAFGRATSEDIRRQWFPTAQLEQVREPLRELFALGLVTVDNRSPGVAHWSLTDAGKAVLRG